MSLLFNCGVCCTCLSIWAVVQLVIMGFCYQSETPILIGHIQAKKYNSYDEFVKKTKKNFSTVAFNCWGAAIVYLITLMLSIFCIIHAKRRQRIMDVKMADDEFFCAPNMPPPPKEIDTRDKLKSKAAKKAKAEAQMGQKIGKYARRVTISRVD